jgi:hypothetical protein
MQHKPTLAAIVLLLYSFMASAQSINPYKDIDINKKQETVTLTKGEYEEIFDEDSIQRIGSALVNIHTMKVVGVNITEEEQRQLDNAMESRFLSVDPLTSKYPWYTPYQYAGNIPIAMIDIDGLEEVSPSFHYDPISGSGSASYPKLKQSEWKSSDRWSESGTFASAAAFNTSTLNSSVYLPVNQIHHYYVWVASEVDKTKSNIKFFQTASDVTGFTGVDGAYTFSGIIGLSKDGAKSLADVNSRLLKENMPVIRDILNKGNSDVVNGKGIIWDLNYVHREQSFLTDVITKNPLSNFDQAAINGSFAKFEFIHPEYSMAKSLLGTSSLDYKNQSHREAIGRSLIFIKHFLGDDNYKETKEFKSAIDYLNKQYGEKNTQNFLNTYSNKFGTN